MYEQTYAPSVEEEKYTDLHPVCSLERGGCGKTKPKDTYFRCKSCNIAITKNRNRAEEAKKNGGVEVSTPNYQKAKFTPQKPAYNKPTAAVKSVPADRISHCLKVYEECYMQVNSSDSFKELPAESRKEIATSLFIQASR